MHVVRAVGGRLIMEEMGMLGGGPLRERENGRQGLRKSGA